MRTPLLDLAQTRATGTININRLMDRLQRLGNVGRTERGLCRLALSDEDRLAREAIVGWMMESDMEVEVDCIGNIFGTWRPQHMHHPRPLMIGSHIDTVINAGTLDGAYGVLAGLEVVDTCRTLASDVHRPIIVAAFTNEEGVRFTPDMMGSMVFAGAMDAGVALATVGTDGRSVEDELIRIGYLGALPPRWVQPAAYLELHIEQGPILESESLSIGVVDGVQGISWRRYTFEGRANHAGTTPMSNRRDAFVAAANAALFANNLAKESGGATVATVGSVTVEPNAVNVIPCRVSITVDMRDAYEVRLSRTEERLATYIRDLALVSDVQVTSTSLVRCKPVRFDAQLVARVEAAVARLGLPYRRLTSAAGHDAQMVAAIAPTGMIFVPSRGGISHSPFESTSTTDLVAGVLVLLETSLQLVMQLEDAT